MLFLLTSSSRQVNLSFVKFKVSKPNIRDNRILIFSQILNVNPNIFEVNYFNGRKFLYVRDHPDKVICTLSVLLCVIRLRFVNPS